jgi:hypothetical protein
MSLLNYPGKLSAAVILQWKGETVASPLTTALKDMRYVTANESLTEFAISLSPGGRSLVLSRQATKKQRFFDDALSTYTIKPTFGDDLDRLLTAGRGTTGTIDCTFTYARFFAALLQQMTRVDADLHNLADPNDSKAILDTFTHSASGGAVGIDYKTATQALKALPCTLVDFEVKPGPEGKPPGIKLVFELDFLTGLDPVRAEAMLKLVAMDWSKLARFGKPEADSRPDVRLWRTNIMAYLANHTDLSRGERFRRALIASHSGKTSLALAKDLRNDIDRLLVTANHWGQAREDLKTEHHQRLLSDLFGTLHQTTWLSSPVSFLRDLSERLSLSLDRKVALILQYGVGHCGEHSQVSFSVLRAIIAAPGAKVARAVLTGNANIDHAFVVYDLDVATVVRTIATAANNTRVARGEQIDVWNLREAISRNAPRVGFVMDPYLDPSVMKPTAKELLDALNNSKRKSSGKATDFLAFGLEFPSAFAVSDIRAAPESERRALVPNV